MAEGHGEVRTVTKRPEAPELSSADLVERLRRRHEGDEWAFFAELRGGTGFIRDSRLDGLAMNLWPSRGLEVHGFEVKVSRGDWLRELKNPAKAEVLLRFCDRFWTFPRTRKSNGRIFSIPNGTDTNIKNACS